MLQKFLLALKFWIWPRQFSLKYENWKETYFVFHNGEVNFDDDDNAELFFQSHWPTKGVKHYFQLESLILTIANFRHVTSWIWTCKEPEFRFCWMKVCSSDNHCIMAPHRISMPVTSSQKTKQIFLWIYISCLKYIFLFFSTEQLFKLSLAPKNQFVIFQQQTCYTK